MAIIVLCFETGDRTLARYSKARQSRFPKVVFDREADIAASVRPRISKADQRAAHQAVEIPLTLFGELENALRDDLVHDLRLAGIMQFSRGPVIGGAQQLHRRHVDRRVFQQLTRRHFGIPPKWNTALRNLSLTRLDGSYPDSFVGCRTYWTKSTPIRRALRRVTRQSRSIMSGLISRVKLSGTNAGLRNSSNAPLVDIFRIR